MRFEYATLVLESVKTFSGAKLDHEGFYHKLNEYGAEGWELVNVFTHLRNEGVTHEVVAVFKRPAQ
jgi:hypothetical protein